MDEITFQSDLVLSDVHMDMPSHRQLMVRLNDAGQPVYLSRFRLLWSLTSCADSEEDTEEPSPTQTPSGSVHSSEGPTLSGQDGAGTQLDGDGDLDVVRRPRAASDPDSTGLLRDKVHPTILRQEEEDAIGAEEAYGSSPLSHIQIEHTMATPLEDVGKQVWRGALLLADYLLSKQSFLQGRTVLELGAGTGLVSIVAATIASTVYCTDVGDDLLAMCQRNVMLNSPLMATSGGVVKVRRLDWLKTDLCTDPLVPFSWSEEDVFHLYGHTTVLLAAEVFYDTELTDALFRTLIRLARQLRGPCTAILCVEKRLNFTLKHLDVTCESYDHFREALQQLETNPNSPDGQLRFVVEPVDVAFPQRLVYERIPQLELWKVLVEPVT